MNSFFKKRVSIARLLSDDQLWSHFVRDLKAGVVAVFPTDTLYGLAVDADSITGVDSIYRMKEREAKKPLIVFIDQIEKLSRLGISPSFEQLILLKKFWPGAFTAIFPLAQNVFQAFKHESIGVRIPAFKPLIELLEKYPGFFLSTSANISGCEPLYDPCLIETIFAKDVGWILDEGVLPVSEPSTVVDLCRAPPKILRIGKIKEL